MIQEWCKNFRAGIRTLLWSPNGKTHCTETQNGNSFDLFFGESQHEGRSSPYVRSRRSKRLDKPFDSKAGFRRCGAALKLGGNQHHSQLRFARRIYRKSILGSGRYSDGCIKLRSLIAPLTASTSAITDISAMICREIRSFRSCSVSGLCQRKT